MPLLSSTDKLKLEQVLEPVETLFVIKEKATNRFKYCGDGELLDNFMKGKPLTSSLPARKNRYSSLVASKSRKKLWSRSPHSSIGIHAGWGPESLFRKNKETPSITRMLLAPALV